MGGSHADISRHVKAYLGVFAALAVFTILTVAASQVHVSTPAHIGIAMVIAVAKAGMVAAIFMHLKWEKAWSIWFVLVLCAFFFAVLMLVPVLTANEAMPGVLHGSWG